MVGALGGHFGPAPAVVAVLAHAISVVGLLGVRTLGDDLPMLFDYILLVLFNFYSLLVLIHQVNKLKGFILTLPLVYVGDFLIDLFNRGKIH